MAEKAKAKKAKALSKKTSVKSKKREELEQPEAEVLQLQAEEMPKRGLRGKASAEKDKGTERAPQVKAEKKSAVPAPAIASTSPSTPAPVAPAKTIPIPAAEERDIKVQAAAPEIISPIQPRVVVNKPEAARAEPVRQDQKSQTQANTHSQPHSHHRNESKKQESDNDGLRLRLSQSLTKKLKEQAADEGISLEEFVGELLAESVVLRAWEIVERKNAMKGHAPQGQNRDPRPNSNNVNSNQGGANRGGQRGNNNQGNKGHRGMSHVRYQTIMDDKATFLEYVRSQEKSRR